jgi:hypothetical protein
LQPGTQWFDSAGVGFGPGLGPGFGQAATQLLLLASHTLSLALFGAALNRQSARAPAQLALQLRAAVAAWAVREIRHRRKQIVNNRLNGASNKHYLDSTWNFLYELAS